MASVLRETFYRNDDVLAISQALLGKHLCSKVGKTLTSGIIVETEAYRAPEDKASHAHGNRRTQRTETMFQDGGVCYIYLCYGIHHLFNVVTGSRGQAHAVLVRALEPVEGMLMMQQRRGLERSCHRLTGGPGMLTQALGIGIEQNGQCLDGHHKVWIEDHGRMISPGEILSSPRVGVDYAGECALWDWRFRIKGNPWTSRPHEVVYDRIPTHG